MNAPFALALLGLLLSGCAPGMVSWPSYENQTVYRLANSELWPHDPSGQRPGRLVQSESEGLEVWVFEVRVRIRAAIGIPYGRMPQDILVVGDEPACEGHRSAMAAKGNPTAPCQRAPWRFVPVASPGAG